MTSGHNNFDRGDKQRAMVMPGLAHLVYPSLDSHHINDRDYDSLAIVCFMTKEGDGSQPCAGVYPRNIDIWK
jgi:hypothetical protein